MARIPRSKVVREFGACVAARRRELGMTQAQLAGLIGIGQDTLSRIESGLASPKLHSLQAYADALRCPIPRLFCRASDGELAEGELLAEILRSLEPEWRIFIRRMVEDMAVNIRLVAGRMEERMVERMEERVRERVREIEAAAASRAKAAGEDNPTAVGPSEKG